MIDVTGNWATGMIDHQRDVLLAVLLAECLVDDAAADEVVTRLADHLQLSRHRLRLAERGPEEAEDHDGAEQRQQHRLGEVETADREDRLEDERVQSGCRESAPVEKVAVRLEGENLVSTHRELLQRDAWVRQP
jgi:hypothetical protein